MTPEPVPPLYEKTPPFDDSGDTSATAPYQGTARGTPPPIGGPPAPEREEDTLEDVFRKRGYRIVKALGEGSYGAVYCAKHVENKNNLVAIKVFKRFYSNDATRFRSEVDFLAQAEGTLGVVGLKSIHLDESDFPYFVMQYAEGGSLAARLGKMSLRRIVNIFTRVVETMNHVHKERSRPGREKKERIIHCDLKPDNILLNSAEEPLVADFGLAQLDRTRVRALGSLFYMAPEQTFEGSTPDVRWDIFALGAILYAMVVGKAPREDSDEGKKIYQAMRRDPPVGRALYREYMQNAKRPEEHWKRVDRRLAEIIDSCIELEPDQRINSTEEILGLLKRRTEWLDHRIIHVTVNRPLDGLTEDTLASQLEKGPLPPPVAMKVFRSVVESVQRMHARGIRHEDLRPENVVFKVPDTDGDSLSIWQPPSGASTLEVPVLGSSTGSLGFTPSQLGYMSPELIKTESAERRKPRRRTAHKPKDVQMNHPKYRGDIYSLGALLHAMLTGKPPAFSEIADTEKQPSKAKAAFAKALPAVQAEAVAHLNFDPELNALVKDCLSEKPDQRPESTGVLLERIDRREHWQRNRKSYRQLVRIATVTLGILSVLSAVSLYLYANRAIESRMKQTRNAHAEYLAVIEQILKRSIDDGVDHVEDLEHQFIEHQVKDHDGNTITLPEYLAKHQREFRTNDDRRAVYLAVLEQELTDWLKTLYPPHRFRQRQFDPVGIQLLFYGDGNTVQSHLVARTEYDPALDWTKLSENHKSPDYQSSFDTKGAFFDAPSSTFRNLSYRGYVHGGSDRPADSSICCTIHNLFISDSFESRGRGEHRVINITKPVMAPGEPDRVLAILSTQIFVRPGTDARFESPDKKSHFLNHWFENPSEDQPFRNLAIVNSRGNAIYDRFARFNNLPHFQEHQNGNPAAAFTNDDLLKCGLANTIYETRQMRLCGEQNLERNSWWLIAYTDEARAKQPILENIWNFALIAAAIWFGIVLLVACILYYLYRQLRYGESLGQTLKSLRGVAAASAP